MADTLAFLLANLPNLIFGFPGHRPGGLVLSIMLAVVAVGLGFIIANGMGAAAASQHRGLNRLARVYVELFRGLPLLLLLLLIFQMGVRLRLGDSWSPTMAALVALTLYSGAYQTEIMRAGLRSAPPALVDSARTLGGGPWRIHRQIKLRHALRVMLPAFTGQAISLFKDTSVVVILGVAELMTVARITLGGDITNAPYWVPIYLTVALLYWMVAFTLSRLALRWERRIGRRDLVHSLVSY